MMTILDFQKKKAAGEKIAMVTCYDYTSAVIVNRSTVDCLLVGDSLAMTMHGLPDTIEASLEMMALHTRAVRRGAKDKFTVADLPFLSYRKSLGENVAAAQVIMQAGAHAVKLEGAAGNADFVRHLVDSGVPVMGHLGLTPQFIHSLGGFRVQGKTDDGAQRLMADAAALQEAGCFSLVLECVPAALGKAVSQSLAIPTIGIGAGSGTDGQVLVLQDLLGLNTEFKPKFVKQFLNGAELFVNAFDAYTKAVKSGEFPADAHSY